MAISGAYHRLLRMQDVVDGRHLIVAFFFEKSGQHLLRSPEGMYRAILCQILRTASWIAHSVLKFDRQITNKFKRNGSGQINYKSILYYVLRQRCQGVDRITIFVDALDECPDYQRLELDIFFDNLINSDEFPNLRICLSSRTFGATYWRWLRPSAFSNPGDGINTGEVPQVEVHLENHDAIRAYIDQTLQPYRTVTLELAEAKEKIVRMSQGIFFWAVSMVERLADDLKIQASQLRIRHQPVPDGLVETYREIIRTAKERSTAFRLFQWMLLAPDLGLQGWRDLMPFLQDKTPRSLKEARGRKSKNWAMNSSAISGDDDWITELRQIICRVSLGLAQVAPLSTTSLEEPIADYHSAAGEAGSWVTADGNKWVVSPVHDSVRQFLRDDLGFTILGNHFEDNPHGEGLMIVMMTCLDFINAREFSGLDVISDARSISRSEESSDSLLSHGDGSARTSITSGSISSAWSFRTKNDLHSTRSHSSETSGGSSTASVEESQLHEANLQIAILAHLKEEAQRCPASRQDQNIRIKDWLEGLGEALDDPNPEGSSSSQNSIRSTRLDIWSSELLSYIMTAFPDLCKMAEKAGVDPRPVIIRLREDGLWARMRCLCEATGNDTTLKNWAESQGLHTWVTYLACLARTRVNPYKSSSSRNSNLFKFTRSEGLDMNLEYCLDGGIHSFFEVESACPRAPLRDPFPQPKGIEFKLIATARDKKLNDHLRIQLRDAMYQDNEPQKGKFIPYRMLRNIFTEEVLANLLQRQTGLASNKVNEVRESYIRILGILLLMGKVPQIEQLFEREMSDACLPIKVKFEGTKSEDSVSLESQVPGKGTFDIRGMKIRQCDEFEHLQWVFLSPFFAKPDGRLQHYKLVSDKQPLPILEPEIPKSRWTGPGYELQEKVRFHPDSFDFDEGKFEEDEVSDNVMT